MIEAHNLVKRYGSTMAVNDLSFFIRPGVVTGFLGPNGARKTTTMRMILGLDAPTQGSVTVGGRSYRDLPAPLREVGALLDAKALHGAWCPARSSDHGGTTRGSSPTSGHDGPIRRKAPAGSPAGTTESSARPGTTSGSLVTALTSMDGATRTRAGQAESPVQRTGSGGELLLYLARRRVGGLRP